jgi:integrase
MKTKLSDAIVRNARLPAGKSEGWLGDMLVAGLGVRLRATSTGVLKQWSIRYRDAIGGSRRHDLGTFPAMNTVQARELADKKLHAVKHGGTAPHNERAEAAKVEAAEHARAADSFLTLAQTYLERNPKNLRQRSLVESRRYLMKSWAPLHALSIHDITTRLIGDQLHVIATKQGNAAHNKARGSASAFYRWAIEQGIVDRNPVSATGERDVVVRDRVLEPAELAAIWNACGDDDYGRVVRLLMVTGARFAEISELPWSEIKGADWILPGARSKNGNEHFVPLTPAALALLPAPREGFAHLFGRKAGGLRNMAYHKDRLDARITAALGAPLAHWTHHDLRRSFATYTRGLGIAPHVVEVAIGHIGHQSKVERAYAHYPYEPEVRAAHELWSDHLMAIVSGRPYQVVPLRRAVSA